MCLFVLLSLHAHKHTMNTFANNTRLPPSTHPRDNTTNLTNLHSLSLSHTHAHTHGTHTHTYILTLTHVARITFHRIKENRINSRTKLSHQCQYLFDKDILSILSHQLWTTLRGNIKAISSVDFSLFHFVAWLLACFVGCRRDWSMRYTRIFPVPVVQQIGAFHSLRNECGCFLKNGRCR